MKAVLIESDILIEVARGRDEDLCARWEKLSEEEAVVACSPVTVAEIWHGARPREYPVLEKLFDVIQCIPIDAGIGRRAGDYLRVYAKTHHAELGDALIAATASIHRLTLWTRNRKHYPMKDLTFF